MSKIVRNVFAAFFALTGTVGCQDRLAPQLNPHPQHVVRIVGRAPASLDIELNVNYAITSQDPACTPSLLQQWGAAGIGDYSRYETLKLGRKGERYQASVVVDKYLPGPCAWRFVRLSGGARLKSGGPMAYSGDTLVTGLSFYDPAYRNQCSGKSDAACEREGNDGDRPVVVPCAMFLYDKSLPGAEPGTTIPPDTEATFMCGARGLVRNNFKRKHLLDPAARQIAIDFYDVKRDGDPTL